MKKPTTNYEKHKVGVVVGLLLLKPTSSDFEPKVLHKNTLGNYSLYG
jgi:hypothetical protein